MSRDDATEGLQEALAGMCGGLLASTVVYPLDVVKTRQQVVGAEAGRGLIEALVLVARHHGVGALYAGLSGEYIKSAVQNFMYFGAYDVFKRAAAPSAEPHKPLSVAVNLLVGMLAGCWTQLFVNPLSVVLTRVQASASDPNGQKTTFLSTLLKTAREEGLPSLYSGMGPAMILCTNPAIQFMVFDRLKHACIRFRRSWQKSGDKEDNDALSEDEVYLSAYESLVIGAIAKTAATIITYPYIMAKVRLQWSGSKQAQAMGEATLYRSAMHVLWDVLSNEGVFALYKGMRTQIVKSVISTALVFTFKEKIRAFVSSLLKRADCKVDTRQDCE